MRRITGTFVLFFLADSIAYLLMDTIKDRLGDGTKLSGKNYVDFIVIGVLSVVSILTYWFGAVATRRVKKKSKVCFTIVLVLIAIISALADIYLLSIMTNVIELHVNLLDRFFLAGFCQIMPIGILRDERFKNSTPP